MVEVIQVLLWLAHPQLFNIKPELEIKMKRKKKKNSEIKRKICEEKNYFVP